MCPAPAAPHVLPAQHRAQTLTVCHREQSSVMAKTPSTPTGRKVCGGHTPSSTIPRPHGRGLPVLSTPMQTSCFTDIVLLHAIHLKWLISKTRALCIKHLQNSAKPRRAGSIIPALEDRNPGSGRWSSRAESPGVGFRQLTRLSQRAACVGDARLCGRAEP